MNLLCSISNTYSSQKVSCGSRTINLRVKSNSKVKDLVAAINEAGLRPPEGWCYPHRFGSFAPPRGLFEDGSQVQWFIDGQDAFDVIASSIEEAKSEVLLHCLLQKDVVNYYIVVIKHLYDDLKFNADIHH